MIPTARLPWLPLVLLCLAGCGDGDPGPSDAPDGGSVVRTCLEAIHRAGASCEPFTDSTPCREYWDFWMGRCGHVEWACEQGVVVQRDFTFACGIDGGAGGDRCDAYVAPPAATSTECRGDQDCGGAGTCWAPGDTGPFYAAGFCPRECDEATPCGEGLVCVELNRGSGCSQCRAACTEDSCSLWETCGDDGRCRPQRCDEGYVCPPRAVCVPGGVDDVDSHGCTTVRCERDSECECGACVLGACALGPGRCDPPRP